ncbi:hypothetical protein QC762_000335 [Podospora pseudocomata]|uniref:Cysteine-rich transmembrane CYSTM domain-containing protein n=2 Tax=Podospora TaxID=5144 RepID=A0ABY6S9V5_PODCO|nr:hypothetical protein QC762_000335 [Podospora pseudocomata]VBB79653.1 Putative protein of unknown function [Podospora comata]
MSPQGPTTQSPMIMDAAAVQRPENAHLDSKLQTSQPATFQPMDTQKPHEDSEVGLRGGDRGGCCPGRFCFIIPCPLPCDCCII